MASIVNFQEGIFINETVTLEGVGDIPVTLTAEHLKKRNLYNETLALHRGIKPAEQINISDPITLFYVVTLLTGMYDPEIQQKLVEENYKNLSADVAEKAVTLARDYHTAAASSAAHESMLITMFDDIFELKRGQDGRVQVVVKEGYNLPAVPANYFDDTEINDARTMEGLPPLFPRNPLIAAEQKLAYISALIAEYPSLMIRVNQFFNKNVTEEVRQAMLKQGSVPTDDAGFHAAGTDSAVSDSDDATGTQPDAGDTGTSDRPL